MPSPRRRLFRRAGRCLTVAVCIAAYLATAIGMPVPVPPKASAGGALACRGGACGCDTAEQCRHACCCSSLVMPAAPSCCEEQHACCAHAKPSPPKPRIRWAIGAHIQKCRGLSLTWAASGVTLPPPAITTFAPPAVGERIPTQLATPESHRAPPPSPPPRLVTRTNAQSPPTPGVVRPCALVSTGGMSAL